MKTPDHFNKATAEELGIDLKLVKEVNTYFWRYGVKKNLSEAKYNAIFIKNFGTISTSRFKLRKEISRIIRMLRCMDDEVRKDQLKVELRKLLERRNEIAKNYLQNKRWHTPKL